MVAKQRPGIKAPDGSDYVTLTDGAGNLVAASAATVATTATAAAPTYIEGSSTNPISVDLSGNLRVKDAAAGTALGLLATDAHLQTFAAQTHTDLIAPTPAGTNGIGNVGGKTVAITVTPTVTASNSYGTNYVVGGLLTFANAFTSTLSGIIQGVSVNIKKVETSGFTFVPFISNPSNTTWTDATVAAINAADVAAVRAPIPLIGSSILGTHSNYAAYGIGMPFVSGSTSLYGILIANAALTNQFASTSDVTVTVKILQDL